MTTTINAAQRVTLAHYHQAIHQLRTYNTIRRAILLIGARTVNAGFIDELTDLANDTLRDYNESRLLVQFGEISTGLRLLHRLPVIEPPQTQSETRRYSERVGSLIEHNSIRGTRHLH